MITQVYNPQPKDVLRLEFMIGNTCNYSCWYCFEGSHEGTHRWTNDLDQLVANFVHLFDRYKAIGKRKLELHIVGGEPTLWPQLGEFVEEIRKQIPAHISISSNGSRTLRWWEQYAHVFDKILLSCHHQQVQVEDLIEQLKTSRHKWFIVAMEVMHKTIAFTDEQKLFVSKPIKRMPNVWTLLRQSKHMKGSPKVKLQDGSVKTVNRNWIVLNKQNDFYGWMCNIGVDSMMIDPAGIITAACRTKLFEEYNIYDKDFVYKFNPDIKPKICDKKNTCMCQPESLLDKCKL